MTPKHMNGPHLSPMVKASRELVLRELEHARDTLTAHDIAVVTGLLPAVVRQRISELRDEGIVENDGRRYWLARTAR